MVVSSEGDNIPPSEGIPLSLARRRIEHDAPVLLLIPTALAQATPDTAPAPDPLLASPRAVSVVTEADIAALQARTVPEAIEETVGVWVPRSGRGMRTASIRGLSGPHNLVLVDGIPTSLSSSRAGPDLGLLVPQYAERIEITRGPGSVQHGGGIGGVIHLHTLAPPTPAEGPLRELRFTAGSTTADVGRATRLQYRQGSPEGGFLLGVGRADAGILRTGGDALAPLSDFTTSAWQAKGVRTHGAHTLTASAIGSAIDNASRTDALSVGTVSRTDSRDLLASVGYALAGDGLVESVDVKLAAHQWAETQRRYGCFTDEDGPTNPDGCLDLTETALSGVSLYDDGAMAGIAVASVTLVPAQRLAVTLGGEGQRRLFDSTRWDRQPDGGFEAAERARLPSEAVETIGGLYAWGDLTVTHTTNLNGVVYRGGELEVVRTTGPMTVGGHAALVFGEADGGPATGVPPLFGRAWLRGTAPRGDGWLELAVRAAGAAPDCGTDCTPGWWTLDLAAQRRVSPWMTLYVSTNNLLDAGYRVHGSGVDAPGRDVRLTLDIQRTHPRG
jgi:outer membrane receptor protein involved in Fe transport